MGSSRKNRKSGNWSRRQERDIHVRRARTQGLRARSVFKLEEIDGRYGLIKPDTRIVDLGCAPGSWSQYAAGRISPTNQIVGVDLLPMKQLEKVQFIQGDFTDPAVQRTVSQSFPDCKVDLVLSDMAPNITGIGITDQANSARLQAAILDFCRETLSRGGNMVSKIFAGEISNSIRKHLQACFDHVHTVKPAASRPQSKEVYLVACGFRPQHEKIGKNPD